METKPAQNIQDTFLNTARKERTNITIYLLSGVKPRDAFAPSTSIPSCSKPTTRSN